MIVPVETEKKSKHDQLDERMKKLFQPPPNKQKTKRYKNIQRTEISK